MTSLKHPKVTSNNRKSRKSRSTSKLKLDQLQRKFTTTLNRVANDLLDKSFQKKMKPADITSLINCMKLLKNLNQFDLQSRIQKAIESDDEKDE